MSVQYLCFSGMGRLNSFTPPTPPKMCTLPLLVVMRRWSTQAPARTCAHAVNISRLPGPACTVGAVDIPKRPYTATMCSSRASLTVFWEGLAIEHHKTHTQKSRAEETMRRRARLDVPSHVPVVIPVQLLAFDGSPLALLLVVDLKRALDAIDELACPHGHLTYPVTHTRHTPWVVSSADTVGNDLSDVDYRE